MCYSWLQIASHFPYLKHISCDLPSGVPRARGACNYKRQHQQFRISIKSVIPIQFVVLYEHILYIVYFVRMSNSEKFIVSAVSSLLQLVKWFSPSPCVNFRFRAQERRIYERRTANTSTLNSHKARNPFVVFWVYYKMLIGFALHKTDMAHN